MDVQTHTLAKNPQEPMSQPNDTASMASTSSIRSTTRLLKDKLMSTNKDRKAQKAMKAAAAQSTLSHDGNVVSRETGWAPRYPYSGKLKPLPDWDARARTAETYMLHAMMR